jgi:hypothetical protein
MVGSGRKVGQPVRVTGTGMGCHRYRRGLAFSHPQKTSTRDAGSTDSSPSQSTVRVSDLHRGATPVHINTDSHEASK